MKIRTFVSTLNWFPNLLYCSLRLDAANISCTIVMQHPYPIVHCSLRRTYRPAVLDILCLCVWTTEPWPAQGRLIYAFCKAEGTIHYIYRHRLVVLFFFQCLFCGFFEPAEMKQQRQWNKKGCLKFVYDMYNIFSWCIGEVEQEMSLLQHALLLVVLLLKLLL